MVMYAHPQLYIGIRVNVRNGVIVRSCTRVGVVLRNRTGVTVARMMILCALTGCNMVYADVMTCQTITIAIKIRVCVDNKRIGFFPKKYSCICLYIYCKEMQYFSELFLITNP